MVMDKKVVEPVLVWLYDYKNKNKKKTNKICVCWINIGNNVNSFIAIW